MKRVCGILTTLGILVVLWGGCSPKAGDVIVLQVGNSKVSLADYESFYTKNSGSTDVAEKGSLEDREHFLDLLTNYKLKLQDAYDRNLLADPEIQKELSDYRSSLASSYLLQHEVTEPGIKQLYERKKVNMRAQHILISVRQDAPPAETLKAYTKAIDIIRRARAGESFDSLVAKNSDDPSAKANHGDLYYFTGGVMVKGFEDAAYGMKLGEISSVPARSAFGYHIIKITDVEPARSIKVRHLMARFQSTTPDSADSAGAYARIRGMQDSLKKGWDFAKLAIKLSEDAGSAPQGGELPWFERRRFVEEFEEGAFPLKVGQVSNIVRTAFGFHIIRLDSAKGLAPFAELRDQLKTQYQKNRYAEDYAAYISNLKKEIGYTFDDGTFMALLAKLDSTKTTDDSAWDGTVTADVRAMSLMTIGGKAISVDSALQVINRRPEFRGTALRKTELKTKLDRLADGMLIDVKTAGLETRSPEFAGLMKEYTDGVVLYKAEQLEVWSKTTVTDSSLKAFYERNQDKFMFPEQVNINEIYVESDTMALLIYDSLMHGAKFDDLAARWNDDPALHEKKGVRGLVSCETDAATKRAVKLKVGEFSEPVEMEHGGYAIVKLLGTEPAKQKTFDQAGAEVSNLYQESESKRLEAIWIDRIKQKYPVVQYKEHLKEAFQSR